MSMATSGVLLRNALPTSTGSVSRACAPRIDFGRPSERCTISVSKPVCRNAEATTNITAMVAKPSLAKPESATFMGNMPEITRNPMAPTSTR